MKHGPFDMQLLSHRDGVAEVNVIVEASAVDAVFERVMREAVALAQDDADVRAMAGVAGDAPIPPATVLELWPDRIFGSVRASLVEWSFVTAARLLELVPVDQPIASLPPLRQGKDVGLRLKIFTAPKLDRALLRGLRVTRRAASVEPGAVAQALAELPAMMAAAGPALAREAMPGDRVVADVAVEADGRPLAGAALLAAELSLDGSLPAELEGALGGAQPGEERSVELPLGRAGARPMARVKVRSVHENERPSVEELARRLGVESAARLGDFVAAVFDDRLTQAEDARIIAAAVTHLGALPIPVPEILVRRRFAAQAMAALEADAARGGQPELPSIERSEQLFAALRPRLEASVRHSLVVAGLVAGLGLRVSEEEVRAFVTERATAMGLDDERRRQRLGDGLYCSNVRRWLLQRRLADELVSISASTGE